ncbi:MAG: HigA family addiction module antidote protein [Desulfovibrio sp.]|nr:HigA family addiction module antidote protein [Desulfovibrio sp.]
MNEATLGPIHPGEILLEEFLRPLDLSQNRLGIDLGIPPQRVGDIVRGRRGITADTALRLARYFGTTPQFWLNLQSRYELDVARHSRLPERIAQQVRPRFVA